MIRALEIMPGALSWITLIGLLVLSWKLPFVVAVFIVLYDLFWLLKTLYLFLHLRASFVTMRKNEKVNWFQKIEELGEEWKGVYHLVVLPMYKESYEVVRETVKNIVETNYDKEKIFLVLGLEERGGEEDQKTAKRIQEEFGGNIRRFLITTHPKDILGELPGKGSNETWAVRQAIENVIDPMGVPYARVLVSVFDIDTRPQKEYFGILTYHFLTVQDPEHASYQPIPLFTNNIRKVPVFARLIGFSSSFWQFMQQGRPEQLVTFSSHSMPLKALVEVGFWNTDIVSEDSRIFFQCYNHYNGRWKTIPLLYPVRMDSVGGKNTIDSLRNLYKQQRRWAWGIENVPFVFSNFWKNKNLSTRKKIFWSYTLIDGFLSWATSSFIIFFFGFLPNVLGGTDFHATVLSYNLPQITGLIINLSTFGIITSAFLSVMLLKPQLGEERYKKYYILVYFAQWILIPVTFIFFSSLPALESQTRMMLSGKFRLGFWRTPKTLEKS